MPRNVSKWQCEANRSALQGFANWYRTWLYINYEFLPKNNIDGWKFRLLKNTTRISSYHTICALISTNSVEVLYSDALFLSYVCIDIVTHAPSCICSPRKVWRTYWHFPRGHQPKLRSDWKPSVERSILLLQSCFFLSKCCNEKTRYYSRLLKRPISKATYW